MTSPPSGPGLTSEQRERRQRVIQAAQAAFVTPEASDTFLTGYNRRLGGRPLDLAIISAAGLIAVETAIYAERYVVGAVS